LLIELNSAGQILNQTRIDVRGLDTRWHPAIAIRSDGDVFAIKAKGLGAGDPRQADYAVHRLNATLKAWEPLRSPVDDTQVRPVSLHGANDGNQHFMFYRSLAGADDKHLLLREWETGKILFLPIH
jgi:hypothetical protein